MTGVKMLKPHTYAIPCSHPAAHHGVFYCAAGDFATGLWGNHGVVLADTHKFYQRLEQDSPSMIAHAKFKFRGYTAEDWLEDNNEKNAPGMGVYAFHHNLGRDRDERLREKFENNATVTFINKNMERLPASGFNLMCGESALIELVRELKLPFIPVAISLENQEQFMALKNLIGYEGNTQEYALSL